MINTQIEESMFENTFIRFCKKSIDNAAIDFERIQKKQRSKEFLYADLPMNIETQSAVDPQSEFSYAFQISEKNIFVDREQLMDAIHDLSDVKKRIITLYYYFNMTDREIGLILNMKRRTVNSNRGSALEEMKVNLEA